MSSNIDIEKPQARNIRNPIGGRDRLLKAALRLGEKHRSISNVGLRELAREAGMHHTAIYRHFQSIEEIALALVELLASELRAELQSAAKAFRGSTQDMIRASAQHYFNYVSEHPLGVIFCAREIHGSLPSLRRALQSMLDDFALDRAEDLSKLDTKNSLPNFETLLMLTRLIAQHTLFAALDYLEEPKDRERIVEQTIIFVGWLIEGANSYSNPKITQTPKA